MGRKKSRSIRINYTEEISSGTRKRNRDAKRSKSRNDSAINYGDKPQSDKDLRYKVSAITEAQGQLISQMVSNKFTFGIGPAGTGKTMVATCRAAELLHEKHVEKIILTRPVVEIGKTMGHLPGDIGEKYEPYLAPFKQYFIECFGKSGYEARLNKTIIPIPINFIQGQTWDNSVVLLDEAQNMTIQEMYMFLTRIGNNTKVFITGDIKQTATASLSHENGLKHFLENYDKGDFFLHGDIGVVEFSSDDVVRSDVVGRIIKFYDSL